MPAPSSVAAASPMPNRTRSNASSPWDKGQAGPPALSGASHRAPRDEVLHQRLRDETASQVCQWPPPPTRTRARARCWRGHARQASESSVSDARFDVRARAVRICGRETASATSERTVHHAATEARRERVTMVGRYLRNPPLTRTQQPPAPHTQQHPREKAPGIERARRDVRRVIQIRAGVKRADR